MLKKLLWQVFALLFLVTGSAVSAEPIFRIVYNNKENPPRIMGDDTSINWSKPGITLELLKMVEKQVNIQFQFKRMPWKRCLYMVENGLADGTFHASYNADRAKYGVYPLREGELDSTRAIYKNTYVIYVKKGSGVTWNGKTFSNLPQPIGTQLSFVIADDLRKMGYEVEEEGSVANNLDKLVAGRISVYADIETIVENTLRKHKAKYSAVKKIQPALKEKVYYLLISKGFAAKHPQLTERIWAAVRDVQTTDLYQEVLKKYEN